MKQTKISVQYSESKLDAIGQFSKDKKTPEELVLESLESLYKKTVPKDVQIFLDAQHEQKEKTKGIGKENPPPTTEKKVEPAGSDRPNDGNKPPSYTGTNPPQYGENRQN